MSENLTDFLVGLNIKQVRRSKNITQGELAKFLQLSRTSITNMESGTQAVSLAHLQSIASYLKVDMYSLLPDSHAPSSKFRDGILPFDEIEDENDLNEVLPFDDDIEDSIHE